MRREIWEFLAGGSDHVIRSWLRRERISPQDRAKLDRCLDMLRSLDFEMVSHKLMAGPLRTTKVYKLRIFGQNKQLRPLLCRGPIGSPADYTLLQGALEIGDGLVPQNAAEIADANREMLRNNHGWRERY